MLSFIALPLNTVFSSSLALSDSAIVLLCAHFHTRPCCICVHTKRHTHLFKGHISVGKITVWVVMLIRYSFPGADTGVGEHFAQHIVPGSMELAWNSFPGLAPASGFKLAASYVVSFSSGNHDVCSTELLPYFWNLKIVNIMFLLHIWEILISSCCDGSSCQLLYYNQTAWSLLSVKIKFGDCSYMLIPLKVLLHSLFFLDYPRADLAISAGKG